MDLNFFENLITNMFVYIIGGFGKVKLARHSLTGEMVAIKIMCKAKLGVKHIFLCI